jgi:hypothetical protein
MRAKAIRKEENVVNWSRFDHEKNYF